jgi:hypothetical protein
MKSPSIGLLLVALFSSTSRSQSRFDGAWVIDTEKKRPFAAEKRVEFSLADGIFRDGNRCSRPMVKIRTFLRCEVLGILGSLGRAEGQLRTTAPQVAPREINQHRPQNDKRAVGCHEQ